MSWQNKVLGLVKKYGTPAKFAASTILNAVIPGSPAVIALVEQAFNTAEKTAHDDWEMNLSKQIQTTTENQARLEQMLDILGGDLQHLFAMVANFEKMPEIAQKLIEESQRSDARLQEAVKKLDGVAHRFDHLEELTVQVLVGQKTTHDKLDDLSAAVRKLMASSSAEVLARVRQETGIEDDKSSSSLPTEAQWPGVTYDGLGKLTLSDGAEPYLATIIKHYADSLTELVIHGNSWRDHHFELFAQLRHLESMRLLPCDRISDVAFINIGKCISLRRLDLFALASSMSKMERIITPVAINNIAKLPHLEVLRFPLAIAGMKPNTTVGQCVVELQRRLRSCAIKNAPGCFSR